MEDACKNAESSLGPWAVNGDSSTPTRIFSLTCGSPRSAKGKAVFSLRALSRLAAGWSPHWRLKRKKTAPDPGRCDFKLAVLTGAGEGPRASLGDRQLLQLSGQARDLPRAGVLVHDALGDRAHQLGLGLDEGG